MPKFVENSYANWKEGETVLGKCELSKSLSNSSGIRMNVRTFVKEVRRATGK
jgi:hypothetical protein